MQHGCFQRSRLGRARSGRPARICEELGFKGEKLTALKINEELPNNISDLHIIVLTKTEAFNYKDSYPLFGIDDSLFKTFNDRPNLLTKKEIRIKREINC